MHKLKIGVLVNPVAGMGGSVGLKGTDNMADEALARGAVPKASHRMAVALGSLAKHRDFLELLAWHGAMGQEACDEAGLPCRVLGKAGDRTASEDTKQAVRAFQAEGVDLVLFAGGDGTARDIATVAETGQLLLGVPAGVKIHSGVYSVTPVAAAEIVSAMVTGDLVETVYADVRDIDEDAFRQGRVDSRFFAELKVPQLAGFLQHVKTGGKENEDLVHQDIAAWVVEQMEPGTCYIIGSGTTVAAVMEELGLENTLLGVDIVCDGELLASDVSEQQILDIVDDRPVKIVVTVIGGQGHIFGRGNQQISARVIRKAGIDNILVLASKTKIKSLEGRPLVVDTSDEKLNREFCGFREVITGYEDVIVYPVTDGSGAQPGKIEGGADE